MQLLLFLLSISQILYVIFIIEVIPSNSSLLQPDLEKTKSITFPQGVSRDLDLEECHDSFSPCSIIQNPFFYPFIVKRLCRCKNKQCPDTYEVKRSYDTVVINNREQIKFCDDLPKCNRVSSILRVASIDNNIIPYHLNCFCPPKRRYWRLLLPSTFPKEMMNKDNHFENKDNEGIQGIEAHNLINDIVVDAGYLYNKEKKIKGYKKLFKCEKMEPCRQKNCGSFRSDLYATYQNCTCASGSLCLPYSNRNPKQPEIILNEALYGGDRLGSISSCIRLPPDNI